MKTHNKILFLKPIEQVPFEDYLNRMASQGWHPVKCTLFYIKFEYIPELKRHYYVEYETRTPFFNDDSLVQKRIELYQEFSIDKILSYQYFDIYMSDSTTSESLTDPQTSLELRKSYSHNFIAHPFIDLIYMIFFLYSLRTSIISVLLNPFIPFIITVIISKLLSDIYYFYRIMKYRKGYDIYRKSKFKSPKTDWISVTFIVTWILFFVTLFQIDSIHLFKPSNLIVIFGIIAFLILAYRFLNKMDTVQSSKITLFTVLSFMCLFLFAMAITTNDPGSQNINEKTVPISTLGLELDTTQFESQEVQLVDNSSSFILDQIIFYYNDESITYYRVHSLLFKPLIDYGSNVFASWVSNSQPCNYENSFERNDCHIYHEGNIIVSSYPSLPKEFIEALQLLHND